ncbi:RodZ family helix-turn-helix domain-containing protein [Rubrivivax gelatinosus]|nr:helix-turn-helix transcriptional regulator [Rubrivivax gelatinosus]MBK1686525.1 hypothetical protein [Rubrivivax gelatinosus]
MSYELPYLALQPKAASNARRQLGMTQATAADQSGLPLHKIKRFEAGNYIPDEPFLVDLRAFYEGRGHRFDDTPEPGAKAKAQGKVFPAGVVADAEPDDEGSTPTGARSARAQPTEVHHMRIALKGDAIGHALDVIEANEDRIDELLKQPVKEEWLIGGLSERSQATHAEVLKLMAENGRLYARLFGRDIGGAPSAEALDGKKVPSTHADLLHRRQADAHKAANGDREALRRKQAAKPADTLLSALFG